MSASRTETILRLAQALEDEHGPRRAILKIVVLMLCYSTPSSTVRQEYLKLTKRIRTEH